MAVKKVTIKCGPECLPRTWLSGREFDTSASLAGQPLRTRSHSWPVRPVEVSIAISGRSFCGLHNAHQGDRTPNPPAAGRVSGVTGHEGLGYIKFTKKIKRCQKKWPFKRGGRPRGGRWWGVLLYQLFTKNYLDCFTVQTHQIGHFKLGSHK